MFEEYQCAGVYIAIQAVLTLYAQGGSHDCHVIAHTPQFTVLHSCYYMEYSHMGRRESGFCANQSPLLVRLAVSHDQTRCYAGVF